MKNIKLIYKKEILETVRDKKTLIVMTIVPALLVPVFCFGIPFAMEKFMETQEARASVVGIVSDNNSTIILDVIKSDKNLSIIEMGYCKLEDIENDKVDVILEINSTNLSQMNVSIYYKSTKMESVIASQRARELLSNLSSAMIIEKLRQEDIDLELLKPPININTKDVSTEKEKSGFFLGLFLPLIIVILGMFSGMYAAIDITAGEKERKTLEMTLSIPIPRRDIVFGKFLTLFTISLITLSIAITVTLISLKFAQPLEAEIGEKLVIPWKSMLSAFPALVLLIVMFDSLMLAIAVRARNYKEAQQYIGPLSFIVIFPVILTQMSAMFTVPTYFFVIPIVNVMLIFKELLMDVVNISHILITTILSGLCALASLYYVKYSFDKEEIMFRT
ncbi:MAG: ABC transporter permease [Bacteroidales bacterium]|nr:ABC transporter permease [Bacteroidales bacterium]